MNQNFLVNFSQFLFLNLKSRRFWIPSFNPTQTITAKIKINYLTLILIPSNWHHYHSGDYIRFVTYLRPFLFTHTVISHNPFFFARYHSLRKTSISFRFSYEYKWKLGPKTSSVLIYAARNQLTFLSTFSSTSIFTIIYRPILICFYDFHCGHKSGFRNKNLWKPVNIVKKT